MAGSLTITGIQHVTGSAARRLGPFTITGSGDLGQVTEIVLSAGINTIPVPATATAVLIEFPADNTGNVLLGCHPPGTPNLISVSPTLPALIAFDSPPPGSIGVTGGTSLNPTRFTFV